MSQPLHVWAPRARTLDAIVDDVRVAMTAAADGWWVGPTMPLGTDYMLSIDGGPPLPDPRSRWQPDGVHGASRMLEPGALGASTFCAVPLDRAVIYELHVGTFSPTGTFSGAIHHLDHLVALGVTHVELMPVAQFPGHHGWGYDGVDLYAAHAPYGGPSGLAALIHACHQRGLAVLIDAVYNHVGPEGNYLDSFGAYHTHDQTPWGNALDYARGPVRRHLLDAALAWLGDYGADGLRLDAVHAIHDPTFVAELGVEVAALAHRSGRPLALIAEYDDHDSRILQHVGAHWNDDFHHALHVLLTGETRGYYRKFTDRDALARVLHDGYLLGTRPYGDLPRDRLVAYTQSHDQIGNRTHGERLIRLVGEGPARIAAAILMCSPFVPMLFQGEEWGASTPFLYFCDLGDELREAVRKGREAEHGAGGDPFDPATREACALDWAEVGNGEHARMLRWYRALIETRMAFPALRDARPGTTRVTRDGDIMRIARGDLLLVINLGRDRATADVRDAILASEDLASAGELPPYSCALVRR